MAHLEISAKLCQRTQRMSGPSQSCSSTVAGSRGESGCAGAAAAPAAGAEHGVPAVCFVLGLSGWKSQGELHKRSLRAKSHRLSARLLAALRRWCPAPPGHPGTALQMDFTAFFLLFQVIFACGRFYTKCVEALLRKYVSGNALLSLILIFFLFFVSYCECRLLK